MGGTSYILLSAFILNEKTVINSQNKDAQCFNWAVLAKYVTGRNKYQIGDNYKSLEEKCNFSGISFPTTLNEIKIFEKNYIS